jgi:hypothetical protein
VTIDLHVFTITYDALVGDVGHVFGTSLKHAAVALLDHLVEHYPEYDWSDERLTAQAIEADVESAITAIEQRIGYDVRHRTFDLGEALTHEHDGEAPAVLVVPMDAWERLHRSLQLDSISTAATPDLREQVRRDLESIIEM